MIFTTLWKVRFSFMAVVYRTIVLFVKKKINRWEKGAGRARQNKKGAFCSRYRKMPLCLYCYRPSIGGYSTAPLFFRRAAINSASLRYPAAFG